MHLGISSQMRVPQNTWTFLSSHFLSGATVRSLHDHKSILWFFLLHDSYSLSAFPQQPLKFQQPAYGLTVTSSPPKPSYKSSCLSDRVIQPLSLEYQNPANSLPWRDTGLVYTLSFSTRRLCTPIFPFLITNFKSLSLRTSLDDFSQDFSAPSSFLNTLCRPPAAYSFCLCITLVAPSLFRERRILWKQTLAGKVG